MIRSEPALELDRLHRAYAAVVAVDDVTLSLAKGEFLTLLGPSGSGKTTTLRMIGGFEAPDGGEIRINGAPAQHLPPYLRDTATIFQSGALFPHKTVADNIAFGLRMRGVPRDEIARRIAESLDVVRLTGKEDRYPEQLSGGQRQRVALARSLAVRPSVLLFDEPLSALDLSLRLQLRAEIRRLHQQIGFSAVYVTHDQDEAMALSDRVAVMNRGRIEQIDRPDVVYGAASTEFVHGFVGESSCLDIIADAEGYRDGGRVPLPLALAERLPPGSHRLYLRPARLRIGPDADAAPNRLQMRVDTVEYLGDSWRYHLAAGSVALVADHHADLGFGPGADVTLGWEAAAMRIFS
ncbi:ABC transporter ATP-binding protein [Shinella sp.]|uniref:ABC transporter ATP-binding protein n=1 Tax=Shinella sp. TaxID=1870904 RepID=UPI0028AFAB16|nr:ABC transporter ATP-binding protein [Shinella sp.]